MVRAASVDWYTQAKKESETTIESSERVDARLGVELHFGSVSVTEQVVGYARKAVRDGSTIDVVPMLMPETTFETEAIWFCPEAAHLEGLEQMPKLLGALHAAEHSLIALLPLWAMCDRWDIGGLSTNLHYQTGRPTIFVYDGHSGGVGITERGFDRFERLGRGHGAHAPALPVRGGLPFVRAEPEVREPQRAARQGGRANAPRADARVVVSIPPAAVRLGQCRATKRRKACSTWH